jgi:hypothetical protein
MPQTTPGISVGIQPATDRCPWCGSTIPRARFIQIQTKIAEEEREKLAAERARVQQEAQETVAAAIKSKDEAAAKVKQLEADKERVRREVTEEATAKAKKEAADTIAAAVRAKNEAAAKVKHLEADKERVRKEATEQATAKAKKEAAATVAAAVKAKDEAAAKVKHLELSKQADVEQVRAAMDKELLKVQGEHRKALESYQKTVGELKRQLERKTANELGDGAEVDVYESLRDAFPGDEISRIKKGYPGADIRHDVRYKNTTCGTILYDSKNRQAWQSNHVTKLRQDQMAADADYAILTSIVFPRGQKHLYVDKHTGVIVVNPAHAEWVVALLRATMIQMHALRLTAHQRAEKRERLYKFITSTIYIERLREAERLTNAILQLDVDEQRTHQGVWKKRGTMASQLRKVVIDVQAEVAAILESDEPSDSE